MTPEIHIDDVERFYKIYDAANGRPSAEQLQRDYIDVGSEGLHTLARLRNVTGARIAETLARNPKIYSDARRCMAVLPRVKERVQLALDALRRLNPEARFPAVTVAVSRGRPAGIGYPDTGIQIGLEAVCAADFMNPNVEDRFVHVIAHEYVHVQQAPALAGREDLTVLERAFVEGGAELISELISGLAGQAHFAGLTQGREKEIETAFLADQDKTDLSAWFDNSTLAKPGDLGYWVGHRIAKTYYQHAKDKGDAVRDILQMSDAKAFLAKSGWYPGVKLQGSPPGGAAAPATHAARTNQIADDDWSPSVAAPQFASGSGPLVLVDAAHGNFHTVNGRFAAFSELLEADGYRVRSADAPLSNVLLKDAQVFVVANAIKGGDDAEWKLPTPSALTAGEIQVLGEWVGRGGSLLLIADHMPFPGAVADLAQRFGVEFLNGFALKSTQEGGILSFTRSSGSLADHAITRGRTEAQSVPFVRSFTGQAFRLANDVAAEPLMHMPADWKVYFPTEAWEFRPETPVVTTRGLLQGAVLRHGKGRVAVFGEAAMFTAQTQQLENGSVRRMGLNHPDAAHNAQFVLNVMHWLSGVLE
jgi:hypothetical protein